MESALLRPTNVFGSKVKRQRHDVGHSVVVVVVVVTVTLSHR